MSNKGCQQSWRCSRHEWRKARTSLEHHIDINIQLHWNYSYQGQYNNETQLLTSFSNQCQFHIYENRWIYCISIWQNFLCDFAQILLSILCARFVLNVALLFPGLSYSKRVLNTCKNKTIDTTILITYTMYTYTIHLLINFNSFWVWGKMFVYQASDSCYRLFTAGFLFFFFIFSSKNISNAR